MKFVFFNSYYFKRSNNYVGLILLYLAVFFYSNCNAQTTIIIQPDSIIGKDALVFGSLGEYNVNYGYNPQFSADAWTFNQNQGVFRSLISFDLTSIPVGAIVTDAKFSLFAWDSASSGLGQHSTISGSNACWLEPITSSWNESTVTWNTQPTSDSLSRIYIPSSISPTQNYIDIDVTSLIQYMVDNPSSNFGLILKLQNESYYRNLNFCSSDHPNSALHPKLEITYFLPSAFDSCIVMQPDSIGGKDALVYGLPSEYNVNYGSNSQFPADAWTFNQNPGVLRSIIDFDWSVIPTNAIINSARLSLYAWDNIGGLGQHSTLTGSNEGWLERITSNWDESTVTWNTQPSTTTTNHVYIHASGTSNENYLNIDVTTLVKDIIANPSSGYGFMLKLQDENYYRNLNFCTSDHPNSSLHPKIEICYTIVSGISNNTIDDKFIFIFPNPTSNIINVHLTDFNSSNSTRLIILNSLGKIVAEYLLKSKESSFDLSSFSKGVYCYQLLNNDQKIKNGKILVY